MTGGTVDNNNKISKILKITQVHIKILHVHVSMSLVYVTHHTSSLCSHAGFPLSTFFQKSKESHHLLPCQMQGLASHY